MEQSKVPLVEFDFYARLLLGREEAFHRIRTKYTQSYDRILDSSHPSNRMNLPNTEDGQGRVFATFLRIQGR